MKKRRHKILAMLLAAAVTTSCIPSGGIFTGMAQTVVYAKEADASLEDNDGITTKGAAWISDYGSGQMLNVTAGWNNANAGHAEINQADALFAKEAFTLCADLKVTDADTTAANIEKKAAFTIGDATESIRILPYAGTFGYGGNGNGVSENVATLSKKAVLNEWCSIALVYSETEDSGVVTVYMDGEKVLDAQEVGFKLSEKTGLTGYIARSFATNFLLNGVYDNIIVTDSAMSEADAKQETIDRLDAKKLQADYDELTIADADDVRENLSLIREGSNGSKIEWTSDKPDVVTDSAAADSRYDGGVITRPEAGEAAVTVNLTADLILGDQTMQKKFTVTVQPKPENLDTDYTAGYLWANFGISDKYEKIFFGYSKDGLSWEKLNKDETGVAQPILENSGEGSDLGVRDPHLIRSPYGDKYWLLGTDLHAEGGGAGGTGWNSHGGSKNLVVWESTDLVHWSEPSLVFAGLDTAGCVWAPEAYYDESTGDYMVYWSARDEAKHDTTDGDPLCVYLTRTRDFKTFSEPQVWLDESVISGKGVNIIDSTITYDAAAKKYYRFSTSDWHKILDVSDSLNGPWTRLINRGEYTDHGFSGVEGLTCYQLPDGTWCAMGDNQGYKAFTTSDLATANFTSATATFDERFRHGSVIRLSKAEQKAVLAAYGTTTEASERPASDSNGLFYSQDFENGADDSLTQKGNAAITADGENHVLSLTGESGTYASLPKGWMNGLDKATISFDVKTQTAAGAFFTFAIGQNNTQYMFLRTREKEFYTAITKGSYSAESKATAALSSSALNTWKNVTMVFDENKMYLYIDGVLSASNEATALTLSELGNDASILFGKSFYSGDGYFKGEFDNIKMYDRALSQSEIVAMNIDKIQLVNHAYIGTYPTPPGAAEDPDSTADAWKGLDDHTAVSAKVDSENKKITSYVQPEADLTKLEVNLTLADDSATMKINGKDFTNGMQVDLSKDAVLEVSAYGLTENWTIEKPKTAYNPVLPGQFADPDIDYFDGKYWIVATTDGYGGSAGRWTSYDFHIFSSEDLVSWEDEGVILDVKNKTPGLNKNGVQIASVPWSVGSAWAPTIEKVNDKYYFYFCAKASSGTSYIGVAVADDPAGPYTAEEEPLLTPTICKNAGASVGQTIDPSIFKDSDGKYYIYFGNGSAAVAELNEDMVSIKEGTMKKLSGMTDFRESVVVNKIGDTYHFTWSCDDAGSENYHVNYGTADNPYGPVTYKYTLLQKDKDNDMLATAHQSVVTDPKTGKIYMAYHRFFTPIGVYTNSRYYGIHRETCINEIPYDEESGLLLAIKPTMEGVMGDVILVDGTVYKDNSGKDDSGKDDSGKDDSGKDDTGKDDPNKDNTDKDNTNKNDQNSQTPSQPSDKPSTDVPAGDNNTQTQPSASDQQKEQAQAGTVSLAESAKTVTSANTDRGDIAGSSFMTFKLKAKEGNKSVKLSWDKVKGAEGYVIYGAACGSKLEQIAKVSGSKKSYTVKKLKKNKYYKYVVTAYQTIYGEERVTATSVSVHCATKGGKYGNPTGITNVKKTISVKKGKTVSVKPKLKTKGKVKTHIAKFRFESSNPAIATINKKGKIKGIKKGTCTVYVYTQNGLYKKATVKVK